MAAKAALQADRRAQAEIRGDVQAYQGSHPAPGGHVNRHRAVGLQKWSPNASLTAAGKAEKRAEAARGVCRLHGEALCLSRGHTPPCRVQWHVLRAAEGERGRWCSQVGHLVEEARSKASSIQQSVSKALTGKSEEGFTTGMRSPEPSYAPAPAWVQFLKSGRALTLPASSWGHKNKSHS